MGKMEQAQTDKREIQRERKETGQTGQGAVCAGQDGEKEVKFQSVRTKCRLSAVSNNCVSESKQKEKKNKE